MLLVNETNTEMFAGIMDVC